ncbi:hypothetical protein LTR53_018849, partial [Teratosphaeriaceae sp. CCFEE 6253]
AQPEGLQGPPAVAVRWRAGLDRGGRGGDRDGGLRVLHRRHRGAHLRLQERVLQPGLVAQQAEVLRRREHLRRLGEVVGHRPRGREGEAVGQLRRLPDLGRHPGRTGLSRHITNADRRVVGDLPIHAGRESRRGPPPQGRQVRHRGPPDQPEPDAPLPGGRAPPARRVLPGGRLRRGGGQGHP